MDIQLFQGNPIEETTDCIVLGVCTGGEMSTSAMLIDASCECRISKLIEDGDMPGKFGQTLMLYDLPGIQAKRILLVGAGKVDDLHQTAFRKLYATAVNALKNGGVKTAISYLNELMVEKKDSAWKFQVAASAVLEAMYAFDKYKSNGNGENRQDKLEQIFLGAPDTLETSSDILQQAINLAKGMAKGVELCKNLANEPGNVCTPAFLAHTAVQMADALNLKCTVLDKGQMAELGMNLLLGVASGSRQDPKLICLEYRGAKDENAKPYVLVGKGLTFDAGGISLKPADKMEEMKYDMSGGASVLGTMRAVAELKLPINLVVIVPASENLPDGAANKPGDIQKSMQGTTVEIINTDAEGRLILADALTYAERFDPELVIDVATLTGACVVALGHHATGLISTDEELSQALLTAGEAAGDRAWRLPIWPEYQEQIKSPFADIANVGGRDGGTITAACFLSRFTNKFKWAHLDIAGTAWKGGKEKGATGRPVPLLVQFLASCTADGKA